MKNTEIMYNRNEIHKQANDLIFSMVSLYTAHSFFGELLHIAQKTVEENTEPNGSYTAAQTKEILDLVDSELREYLDH